MTDFLLELLSEEIPARMQAKAAEDLARLFAAEIGKAGLTAAAIETYATPRRLALIARGLPEAMPAVAEEIKGPRADAPAQALAGFLGKTGLTRAQLIERSDAKGKIVLFALIERPGRATADVLADAVPAIVRGFPWPKSMRWGDASAETTALRWVRPLRGIVALFGEAIVPFAVDGIESGAATVGHRFRHPGIITIGSADDYSAKLRACHVILDPAERQAIIREGAQAAAVAAGLTIVPDDGLVAENAGLTEWPVPLLGRFDSAFLAVPREVIQLTMRTNQKYFACVDRGGALAPAFVCTANIDAADGGASIVAGNEKVLAARLADAKFFWDADLRVPLAEQAAKLDRIVFHEKLGTVADKAARIAKLARWLVEEGVVKPAKALSPAGRGLGEGRDGAAERPAPDVDSPHPDQFRVNLAPQDSGHAGGMPDPELPAWEREKLADLAEQAGALCKADLVTGMVGEFPELQGVIGGYIAAAQGIDPAVAEAIRDHYKPVGQGDDVPTAPVTVAVSLADKLDTIAAFFSAGLRPTGSKDPFALRRAVIGVIGLVTENGLRVELGRLVYEAETNAGSDQYMKLIAALGTEREVARRVLQLKNDWESSRDRAIHYRDVKDAFNSVFLVRSGLLDFFADRLKVQQREAGVRHDLIDAVFALGGEDDLVRLLARVHALQAFIATEDGASLLAGYKRAANILRIEEKRDGTTFAPVAALHYVPQTEEVLLLDALDNAEPAATRAIEAEDFGGAMAALAALRVAIDAFFEGVTVNDPDPAKRIARLGLLVRIRDAVHHVADFSRIEG